jgi:Ca-activated chloride channel family protein
LKVQTAGNTRIKKLYPSDLPDLFQGDQLVIAGRYSEPGETTLTVEGTAEGESKRFAYKVKFPETAPEYAFVPRLWATRRVGYLLDQIRLHGDNQELRQEVTELARQYGIVTPYTAYLILEDETRRGVPLAAQSLPRLSEDQPAQEVARKFYTRVNREKSGDAAVAGARYGMMLRQADNAQALSYGNQEAQRGLAATATQTPVTGSSPMSAAASAQRLANYSQQSQFVNGRNFFLNGKQWLDANVQSQTNANRIRIQFNSNEYFDLLKQHPNTAPWLALGQNVQFTLNGSIYDIVE